MHLFMPILDCGKQRRIESVMILAFPQVNGSGGGNGSDPGGDKVKRLSAIADRVGCNLVQLQLAWQLRNQVRPLMHFFSMLFLGHKNDLLDVCTSGSREKQGHYCKGHSFWKIA